MLRHLINLFLWSLPVTRFFGLRRRLLRWVGLRLGEDVSYSGRGWIYGRGDLQIGDATWLSPEVVIYTHPDAPIVIGERCDIGPFVRFVTGSHEVGDASRRAGAGVARPIVVGAGSWIGARATILGGSSIGKGCIVAAGAVVTSDLPDNTLAAGVPARVKKVLPP